jgi:hypothetical protein
MDGILSFQRIDSAIRKTATEGATLVEGIIAPEFLAQLAGEVKAGPFEQAQEGAGKVVQRFDRYAFLREPEGMPFLRQLQLATEELIRSSLEICQSLGSWNAIDIVVQRYGYNGVLTGHKDLARHPYIIASFTVTGSCRFEVLETRDGQVIKSMQPKPGDLMLLRAPGLASPPGIDDRPFHRVSGALDPDEPRISVTFRDNIAPDQTIYGFTYLNG